MTALSQAVFSDNASITKFVNIKYISIPIYGNWCGPGYPKPDENPQSIDALDEACKRHDLCYRSNKTNVVYDNSCDLDVLDDLEKIDNKALTQDQVSVKSLMYTFFYLRGKVKLVKV